jgi:hypothetical protein
MVAIPGLDRVDHLDVGLGRMLIRLPDRHLVEQRRNGTDEERFARFLDILDFENPDAVKSPEELAAEEEAWRRIADYLQFNNFKDPKKGWGDTSQLGSHLFGVVRHLVEASQKEKH